MNLPAGAQVPELPPRLVRPPRRERWWAAAREVWGAATWGARATAVGGAGALVTAGVLYLLRPGPCVALRPVTMDVAPHLARLLPTAAALESYLLQSLKRRAAPVLVLGGAAGSDTRISARIQGLRDVCVPERQLQLDLRCWDQRCRFELVSRAPGAERRSSFTLPAASGLTRLEHGLDQLLAGHLDTLLPR